MESNEIRAQLREAEWAAAAPFVLRPKGPGWQGALLALVGPLLVLVVTQAAAALSNDGSWGAWGPLPGLAITLIAVYVTLDQRKRHGALPKGKAPRELVPVLRWYYIGAGITVLILVALALLLPLWWSLPLSLALTAGGAMWVQAAYERAAARVRARLA